MKLIFTRVIFIYALFWCFGCSPKQTFYLSNGDSSTADQKGKFERATRSSAAGLVLETKKAENDVPSDASLFSVSNQSDYPSTDLIIRKITAPENDGSSKYFEKLQTRDQPKQKVPDTKLKLKKKYATFANNDKPNHKPANLAFLLGLAGILLALSALFAGGIPLLLALIISIPGYITSKNVLAKIKRQPEQYGGKKLAIAGLVMSGLVLLLFIAFILYILAFAGAFA